jgi:zinc protease
VSRAGLGAALALATTLAACAVLRPEPAWKRPPPPIAVGPVVPQQRLHRSHLENGLEVLVLEDHRLPRASVGLVTRRGAADEPLAQAGIASLTLDVMKRGAGARDALALARAVERMGATLDADVGWDSASVSLSGLSEDTDRLFEILADVVRRPRFDPAEVTRARAEQLASFESEEDEPAVVASRQLARVLYDGHRYGLPADGAPASVSKLDPAALRAFHRQLFTPDQAIVYAVGDVSPEDVVERVRSRFGDWAGGPGLAIGPPPPVETPSARRVVIVDRPELAQAQIVLAHEGISRRDPKRIPASLMNTVLGGGGFLSRLVTKVRADAGLAYSIGSNFSLRWWPGPFLVSTSTRVPEAGHAVEIVLAELARMKTEPPTASDLRLVKSFSAGRFVLALETPEAIAGALMDLDVYELPSDSLDTYRSRVQNVTRDEILDAADRLLHPDRIAIVAVGPAEKLRSQLEQFGAVTVVPR